MKIKILYLMGFLIPFSIYSQSVVLPSSDPVYSYLRIVSKENHSVQFYQSDFSYSYNFVRTQLIGKYYPFSDLDSLSHKMICLRLFPELNISNSRSSIEFIGEMTASINKNVSYIAAIQILPEDTGEKILGTAHSRFGYTGRFVSGALRYANEIFSIDFGRLPVRWGESWESSVIFSGDAPVYDRVRYSLYLGNFKLETFAAQLSSVKYDNNKKRIKRFLSGHRLSYFSKSGKWIFNMGDALIYTGINRSFELHYLNPIIPFLMADFENENEGPNYGENDNTILFCHGRYIPVKNFSAYFELFVDEFQIDKKDRSIYKDALAYKLGIDGCVNILNKDIYFESEYTRVYNWTYLHHGQYTNIMNRGIPLGYYLGPDVQSLFFKLDMWILRRCLLTLENTYYEKGSLSIDSKWDNIGNVHWKTPSEPVSYYNMTRLNISYNRPRLSVDLGLTKDLNLEKSWAVTLSISALFSRVFNF